jgi:hypothetical protein
MKTLKNWRDGVYTNPSHYVLTVVSAVDRPRPQGPRIFDQQQSVVESSTTDFSTDAPVQ